MGRKTAGCVGTVFHPFRTIRLFFRMALGKPLPAKYQRKLEKAAKRQGLTVEELWDQHDGIHVTTRATELAWDEEYEQYDGSLDID